jgi:HAMP domain-containing protein
MLFGESNKVSAHKLDAMNWYFALHYPESRITEGVRRTMGVVHKNTLLMALLFAIVLYWSLRYFVTNRITRLAHATADVNITQWQEYVPETGSDEISMMGRSINGMLDKINAM